MRTVLRLLILTLAVSGCAPADPVADVRQAVAGEPHGGRPFATPLTVSARHRTCAPVRDSALVVPRTQCDGFVAGRATGALARRLEARLRETPDAATLHAVALRDLVWGDTAGNALDSSISRLRTAARMSERPGPVLADLAAAHLVRAERRQDARDLLEAMDAAMHALEDDSTLWTARFGLALALDQFALPGEAARAWSHAAAVAPDEAWRAEALAHARRLTPARPDPGPDADVDDASIAAFAGRAPLSARQAGWNRALGDWGTATLAGNRARADSCLRLATVLGMALARAGRDASLRDAATAVSDHLGDEAATRRLAHAHAEFAAAEQWYERARFDSAARHYQAALDANPASEALRLWSTLFLGAAHAYTGRDDVARRLVGDVIRRTDTVHHVALAARAYWIRGNMLHRAGSHDAGNVAIRRAESLYERAGETEYLAAVQAIDAEVMLDLGHQENGYAKLVGAMRLLEHQPASLRRHNALYVAVQNAARDGMLRAASLVQQEHARVARAIGNPVYVLEATLSRDRLGLGARDRSSAEFDEARTLLGELGDSASRSWFTAELQLAMGLAGAAQPTGRLVSALDSAVAFYAARRNAPRLLSALLARTQAALGLGDTTQAIASFDRALHMLDEQYYALPRESQRAALLDRGHDVLETMVKMHVGAARIAPALALLERGRASLTGRRATGGARHHPRPGEISLVYAALDDEVLIWVVDGRHTRLARTPVARATVQRTVERVRTALELQAGEVALRGDFARLHEWLVTPVRERLETAQAPLVIVADDVLGDVPFAALRDDADGRLLVESHSLRFSTSLASATGPRPRRDGERLLLVADPTGELPQASMRAALPPLPGAQAEIEAITRLGRRATTVLSGSRARRDTLVQALRTADIAHYAGHAVFDDEQPQRSYLALAGDAGMVDRLSAADLATLDLSHLQLVVLSACQTQRSRSGRPAGFASLTGALLDAGSAGVVGSLWRVDDELTRVLMVDFHREYHASGDAASALRLAQLRALGSPDVRMRSPVAWAAFRYSGR